MKTKCLLSAVNVKTEFVFVRSIRLCLGLLLMVLFFSSFKEIKTLPLISQINNENINISVGKFKGPPQFTGTSQVTILSGSSLSCDSERATFTLKFKRSSSSNENLEYLVGTFNSCFPTDIQHVYTSYGGRSYDIAFYPGGYVTFRITSGSALPANTDVELNNLYYDMF